MNIFSIFQYFLFDKSVHILHFWRKFHSLVLLSFYYLLLLPAVKKDFQIPLAKLSDLILQDRYIEQ